MDKSYISYKNIFRIAIPVMVGSLGNNIINLTDISLLGRVGKVELGAAAVGGIFYFIVIMMSSGLSTGMQILIARRVGEKNDKDVGPLFDHQLYMILAASIVAFLVLHFYGGTIVGFLIHSDKVREATSQFVYYRSYGVFFGMVNTAFLAFYVGIGRTFIINFTTIIMAFVNGLAGYCLIFGKFGFPQLGVGGSGLGSAITEVGISVLYLVYTIRSGYGAKYFLFRFPRIDFGRIKKMLLLAYPLVFQYTLSISTWFGFFIIIEHMGEQALAVSNIVKTIYISWGIPTWALGSTANSMVSNAIGQGRPEWVKVIMAKICGINFLVMTVLCALLYFFMHDIIMVFSNDASLYADSEAVVPVAIIALLIFSCAFVVMFCVSGTGSSLFAFFTEFISVTCYTVFAFYMARIAHRSLPVVWCAEVIYWSITLTMGLLFFRYGRWLKKI